MICEQCHNRIQGSTISEHNGRPFHPACLELYKREEKNENKKWLTSVITVNTLIQCQKML